MKKNVILLVFVLFLFSSCAKKETITETSVTSPQTVESTPTDTTSETTQIIEETTTEAIIPESIKSYEENDHFKDTMSADKYLIEKHKAAEITYSAEILDTKTVYPNFNPLSLSIVKADITNKTLVSAYRPRSGKKYEIKQGEEVLVYLMTTGDLSQTYVGSDRDERFCFFEDCTKRKAIDTKFMGNSFEDYKEYYDFATSKGYHEYNGSKYILCDDDKNYVNLINLSSEEIITSRFILDDN
ncbi:MAG: hypothetical protein Q4F88_03395 [Eubacteriales bacterium]|nr:hypothetical protein [Eubacteriales bacterium]